MARKHVQQGFFDLEDGQHGERGVGRYRLPVTAQLGNHCQERPLLEMEYYSILLHELRHAVGYAWTPRRTLVFDGAASLTYRDWL
jgi:hypothetical protein